MKRFFVLVDDDAEDAELFSDALSDLPVPVDFRHFDSGDELIEVLESAATSLPDLIFLDLNMPRMTGWQCLDLLKGKEGLKEIPVVIYSTSSAASDPTDEFRFTFQTANSSSGVTVGQSGVCIVSSNQGLTFLAIHHPP